MDRFVILILFGLLLVHPSTESSRSIECAEKNGAVVPVFSEENPKSALLNGESDLSYDYEPPIVMDAINDIAAKVDLVNSRIDRILDECTSPTRDEDDPRLQVASSGDCAIEDFGLCFWLESYPSRNTTMLDAWELCGKRPGGRPASIYSAAHYIKTLQLMRTKILRPKFYIYIWLGMKIDQWNKVVTTLEGNRAPFVRWYAPMYPIRNSRYTQIYLYADVTRKDGFMNFDPKRATNGVLCETMI